MKLLYSKLKLLRNNTNLLTRISTNNFKYHTSVIYKKSETSQSNDFESPSLSTSYEQNRNANAFLPVTQKQSMFHNFKEFLGFQGDLKYPQPVLTFSAYRLYMCIQFQIDYEKMYKLCNTPDTMYSYCLITFLHIWMLSVPLMQLGKSGHFVRKALYRNMWKDIEARDRKLKSPMSKKDKTHTYTHLNDIFRAYLIGFDEGLLSDDTVLAGAIWRHVLEMDEIKDYAVLGKMCDYIRKNAQHLDNINEIDYLKFGIVSFVDLDQKEVDHHKARKEIIELIKNKETSE